MLPELAQLLILQDKDQQIRRLRADLKKMPSDAEKAKAKLAGDQQATAAAKEAAQLNEVAIKNVELQIQTRRETIVRLKTQQFETRKNEEYAALGHEAVRYTAEVAKLEDDQLVLMEKAEELKAAHDAAAKALADTQAYVTSELGKIKERYINVTAQTKELEVVRAGLAAKVEETLLGRYERIAAGKGDAIAELNGHVCKGCNMKVTAATFNAARAEREFVNCPNCSRIVYIAHFDD